MFFLACVITCSGQQGKRCRAGSIAVWSMFCVSHRSVGPDGSSGTSNGLIT